MATGENFAGAQTSDLEERERLPFWHRPPLGPGGAVERYEMGIEEVIFCKDYPYDAGG